MSSHVERLEARRRLLQAECAVQRGEIGAIHADLDAGAARADQLIAAVRRLTPVLLAGAVVATVVIGPGRLLGLARQGLALGLLASRAGRLLR
jgi:YqjK-like protein